MIEFENYQLGRQFSEGCCKIIKMKLGGTEFDPDFVGMHAKVRKFLHKI